MNPDRLRRLLAAALAEDAWSPTSIEQREAGDLLAELVRRGGLVEAIRYLRRLPAGLPVAIPHHRTAPFSAAARRALELWTRHHNATIPGATGAWRRWLEAKPDAVRLVAVALALLRWARGREKRPPARIDGAVMRLAIEITDGLLQPLAEPLATPHRERDAAILARYLAAAGRREVDESALARARALPPEAGFDRYRAALERLAERRLVDPVLRHGRRGESWRVSSLMLGDAPPALVADRRG